MKGRGKERGPRKVGLEGVESREELTKEGERRKGRREENRNEKGVQRGKGKGR